MRLLLRGQTNFLKSLFSLDKVYRPELFLADHDAAVAYQLPPPPRQETIPLYVHPPRGRKGRAIDQATERFVEQTRMGTAS